MGCGISKRPVDASNHKNTNPESIKESFSSAGSCDDKDKQKLKNKLRKNYIIKVFKPDEVIASM